MGKNYSNEQKTVLNDIIHLHTQYVTGKAVMANPSISYSLYKELRMKSQEIWKVIPSHPKYQVSNLGNIKHIRKGSILKPHIDKRGYLKFTPSGNRNEIFVHVCFAEAFICLKPNKLVVDHIDGDKLNNHISNLRYCTQRENVSKMKGKSKYASGVFTSENGRYRSRLMIDKKLINLGTYSTIKEASKVYQDKVNEVDPPISIYPNQKELVNG